MKLYNSHKTIYDHKFYVYEYLALWFPQNCAEHIQVFGYWSEWDDRRFNRFINETL